MNDKVAILELKYGNIYGGFPNFFAIAEVSLLVFEKKTKRIFLESWANNADVDYVSVFSKTDELGHTISRAKEVINMSTGKRTVYDEEFHIDKDDLEEPFGKLRFTQRNVRGFLMRNFKKYNVRDIVTFDGRRDIFLAERSGVRFDRMGIYDLQRDLNKETDYLFSLNKLAVAANFRMEGSYLRSNNQEYWLHPIAGRQLETNSAAYDAARLLMIYNEYADHHDDFMMRAALLLNKIQTKHAK